MSLAISAIVAAYCSSLPTICGALTNSSERRHTLCPATYMRSVRPMPSEYLPSLRRCSAAARTRSIGSVPAPSVHFSVGPCTKAAPGGRGEASDDPIVSSVSSSSGRTAVKEYVSPACMPVGTTAVEVARL